MFFPLANEVIHKGKQARQQVDDGDFPLNQTLPIHLSTSIGFSDAEMKKLPASRLHKPLQFRETETSAIYIYSNNEVDFLLSIKSSGMALGARKG